MNKKERITEMLQNGGKSGIINGEKKAAPVVDPGLAYILSMSVEEKRELLEIWKNRKVKSE